jgi:hypothetical protein
MTRVREIVAAILASTLLLTPVWATPVGALGTVVAADRANIGSAIASVGATVFDGDRISTAQAGSMQLRTASARFLLSQSSFATLGEVDGIPSATLTGGSATFSTANARAFVLHVSKAVIRPRSDEPSIGLVIVLDAKQLIVKCVRGALTLTVDDDSRVVPEGAAYRVVLDPAAVPGQSQPPAQGAGTNGAGRPPLAAAKSRFVWFAAGGVALVTAFAVDEALESSDRP